MKRFVFLIIPLLIIFTSCSDDEEGPVDTTNHYDIAGYITNGDGVPVEGTMITLFRDGTDSVRTDANGYYIFRDQNVDGEYVIRPTSSKYDFDPDSIYIQNLTQNRNDIDFTAHDYLTGYWVSEGGNIAPMIQDSSEDEIVSIRYEFGTSGSYTLVRNYSSAEADTVNGTVTTEESPTGEIHKIVFVEAGPNVMEYTGIYDIDMLVDPNILRLEITDPDQYSPPEVNAGFGSTEGGAFGNDNVQVFVREED